MIAAVHTRPTAMVKRSRLRSATEEPPRLEETPPPNMSDKPPPLPLCNKMSRVWKRLVMISTTCRPMRTAVTSGWSVRPVCSGRGARSQVRLAQAYAVPARSSHPPAAGSTRVAGRHQVLAVPADARELLRLQAGAADEGAVDVLLRHDRGDVRRLDRAAVQHPDGVRDVTAPPLGEPRADRRAHLLRIVRCGHLAGPNGPHRLVRDDERASLLLAQALQGAVQLGEDVRNVLAGLADLQPLTDAEDRRQAVPVRRLHLGAH